MKTVVLGLFDEREDARRVLAHLAASPLDLEAIQVLSADIELQRALAEEAGLPPRRSARTGLVIGAILGGFTGLVLGLPGVGADWRIVTALGPLLLMAAGTLLGALAGLLAGALSRGLRLPPEHAEAVLAALDEGATVLLVDTENLPTARALSDLFLLQGARALPMAGAPSEPAPAADGAVGGLGLAGAGAASSPAESIVPTEHLPFAPPWLRGEGDAAEPPVTGDAPAPTEPAAAGEVAATVEIPAPTEFAVAGEIPATVAIPAPADIAAEGESAATAEVAAATEVPTTAEPAETAETAAATAEVPTTPEIAAAAVAPAMDGLPLSALGLSSRVARALEEGGVGSLAELRSRAEADGLRAIPGIGPAAEAEIRSRLAGAV